MYMYKCVCIHMYSLLLYTHSVTIVAYMRLSQSQGGNEQC